MLRLTHLSTFAEAKAEPGAARPERATADEMVNDIICRFKNLFELKKTEGIILLL